MKTSWRPGGTTTIALAESCVWLCDVKSPEVTGQTIKDISFMGGESGFATSITSLPSKEALMWRTW